MMRINRSTRRRSHAGALAAVAAALLAWAATCAAADTTAKVEEALSDADTACVACHAAKDMTKKLANGDELSLTIDGDAFAHSVHRPIGCAGCHPKVSLPDHPGNVKTAASARDYAIAQAEACRTCHEKTFKIYERSLHAAKLHEGNAAAPTCAGCHQPHQVARATSADGPDRACFACHGDPTAKHAEWLPNAAQHLDAIACSACHAPDALRQVDLRLYAAGKPLADTNGTLQFEKLAKAADRNHDGLDALEFRTLLVDLRRNGTNVSVRGHMQLRDPSQAHEITRKPTALKACVDCHREDATPFAKVTVSVIDADGRLQSYDAHKDVLLSAMSAETLRSFYAVGGTRIKLLDVLLALGLAGGIAVPAIHMLIRRSMRAKKEGSDS